MTSEIYWLNDDLISKNQLGTMARPRGNDWLEDEIKGLKSRAVDILVSMLEQEEVEELELSEERLLCEKWNLHFINFPILDISVPENEDKFVKLAVFLADEIQQNKKVVVHCRAGIGRSSMLAAAVLIRLGVAGKEVFETISRHRGLSVPDTKQQRNWLLSLENALQSNR
jgi:protein-tyrosine phosphatase